MSLLEWLRLAGEVIALLITWFASRGQLKRAAIRRLKVAAPTTTTATRASDLALILFPRRGRDRHSRQRRLFL